MTDAIRTELNPNDGRPEAVRLSFTQDSYDLMASEIRPRMGLDRVDGELSELRDRVAALEKRLEDLVNDVHHPGEF
jgi:hypothetical protein